MATMFIIATILGICSTSLVYLWFFTAILNWETPVSKSGFERGWNRDELPKAIWIQVAGFAVTFVLVVLMYFGPNVRMNFWGLTLPIVSMAIFQIVNLQLGQYRSFKTLYWKQILVGGIAGIFFVLSCINLFTGMGKIKGIPETKTVPISVTIGSEQKPIVSTSDILVLFNSGMIKGPYYTNGMFAYLLSGGQNGEGVGVISRSDGSKMDFIKINFTAIRALDDSPIITTRIHNAYPMTTVKYLSVVIAEDLIPYGKYAIVIKPNIFKAQELNKYMLMNLVNGNMYEYEISELPEWAK